MSYYPDLLAAAFTTLSGEAQPEILALTFSTAPAPDSQEQNVDEQIVFPLASLPIGSDHRRLNHDESFLDLALASIAQSPAKCVFIFPPVVGERRVSDRWREQYGWMGMAEVLANKLLGEVGPSESTLLQQPLSRLCALALLVPPHFVNSMRSSKWRNEFFPAHAALVIEHEHSNLGSVLGLSIHPAVRFSTVIFQRQPGPLRFFKITEDALADGADRLAADLRRLLKQPAGKTRYGYVYAGQPDENYPCSYDFYSEETAKLREEISELGERVSLASVADVLLGFQPIHPQRQVEPNATNFLYINAPAISRDGRVDLSEVQTSPRPALVKHYLQDGDLCIRQVSRIGDGFVVGVYEGDGRPIAFNHTVLVVRPHASLKPAQRQVLLSFLRSPMAHRLGDAKRILSSLGDFYRVTPSVLRDFPVPLADEELVGAIQQLTEAKAAFSKWIENIDQEANAIVMETTASGSRQRMLQAGQLARQRHRAAQQVEELDYLIRTQFPHPLAHVWRELQVAGPDRYHRLRAVTKAAEGHTCFLAQIAILISRAVGQPIAYVHEIAKRLAQRKSGTNFGDWFAILKEINESRAFRQAQSKAPFAEVMQLRTTETWEEAIKKLMDLRNDDSHGRIAPVCVSSEMLMNAEAALETVYRTTEFLTDYQFMLLTNTRFDSIRQLNHFQYRDLTGDNALAPLRLGQSPRSDLESGSLYLRDRNGVLHLCRPLLHYLECPECHLMSTFFLDTYDGSGKDNLVGLKSFERSSVRKEALADDFRHIGLVPKENTSR